MADEWTGGGYTVRLGDIVISEGRLYQVARIQVDEGDDETVKAKIKAYKKQPNDTFGHQLHWLYQNWEPAEEA